MVREGWPPLALALGGGGLLGPRGVIGRWRASLAPPPLSILDLNAAEALVARTRLLDQPRRVWEQLRELSTPGEFHAQITYVLEGAFHRLMGEQWLRHALTRELARLNLEVCVVNPNGTHPRPDHLSNRLYVKLAGAADTGELDAEPKVRESAAWRSWRLRWRRGTELSLALRELQLAKRERNH